LGKERGGRATGAEQRDLTTGKENQHSGGRYHLVTPECQKIKIIGVADLQQISIERATDKKSTTNGS
jgi:hypothetical protein